MITLKKVVLLGAGLLGLIVLGSLGYVWIEGWNFFDGLYMTVTTLATVGYGETHPLSRMGRAYTIVLILAGAGFMLYIISAVARAVVEGEIRQALGKRKLVKQLQKLKDHFIICGFGRIGEAIANQLKLAGAPFVVVDNNPEHTARLEETGYNFVVGDATRDEVLQEAGIERARGLVAVVGPDASNVFIILSARSLNPGLFIVARAEGKGARDKLLKAGADKVESPHELGGRKMAHTILRPTVVTFMELAMQEGVEWSMEEVAVGSTSPLIGMPIRDTGVRAQLNLILIAIKRADGEMLFNPTPDTAIQAGDTLIAVGLRHNLEALEKMLG